MDPKVAFWSVALLVLASVVGLAGLGIRRVRRGDVRGHRRCMLACLSLVVVFLAAFLVKSAWLGREDLALWSRPALLNLWIHETFVTAMLLAGATAGALAFRLRRTRRVTGSAADAEASPTLLRWHRRAGWTAVVCSSCGLATAVGILAGMIARSG
jgi:uncharacterized membrane protein YozB (DUF420 family)